MQTKGVQNNTVQGTRGGLGHVLFSSVEHEEGGESGELNEGVGRHKFDGEVCGWDEWMM